ncbi:MAG: hypothetical protein ACI9BF_000163 [Candidatus Paceibacteria bacterium]|jgi:hypothetical protein
MDFIQKIKKVVGAYFGLFVQKRELLIVLAPGRVGSIALNASLRAVGVFSFKLEFLEKDLTGAAFFLKNHIFKKNKPAKLITIIRDPVAMMLTYYMGKAYYGWLTEAQKALADGDLEKLKKHFISDVLTTDRLTSHLDWFTTDFQKLTNIDVYSYPFNTNKRWSIVENGLYPTLIFRTELDDEIKVNIIKNFLNIDTFTLSRANTADVKAYKDTYEKFKDYLTLPAELLNNIYSSTYCTHFFSAEEISILKSRWS